MFNFVMLICLLGLSSSTFALSDSYNKLQIFQFSISSISQAHVIEELEQNPMFDLLKTPRKFGEFVHVMVYPKAEVQFFKIMAKYQISVELIDGDVERSIRQADRQNLDAKRRQLTNLNDSSRICSVYLTLIEIKTVLQGFADDYDYVTLEDIGKSFENRSIFQLKISKNDTLPIIWIDAGIHAREWIAPATALCFIEQLLTEAGVELLNGFQFYVAPSINPDGYEYSHTTYRLWRKNRAPSSLQRCFGVDLNRNFPFKWGGKGTSSDPCSQIYRGISAGDQLETKAVIKQLESIKEKVALYLSFHSYGQYILLPYGYDQGAYPPTFDKMMEVAGHAVDSILQSSGNRYTHGNTVDLLYAASGGSHDYAIGSLEIPFSYTIELADTGMHGFLLPPSYIPQVTKDMWTTLTVFAQEIKLSMQN